jgi:NADPH:quinone reductase-like Zn-dependent oxidoreductase
MNGMTRPTNNQTDTRHTTTVDTASSRAICVRRYGGPDVLQLEGVDRPTPGPGQLLIAVRAAGINPADLKIRSGDYHDLKPMTFPYTPGTDVAGTVVAIGPSRGTGPDPASGEENPLAAIRVGDDVLGFAITGGYAQHAVLDTAAIKPADLPWTHAAAIPVAAETATRSLNLVGVERGQVLLVHGAAGSVGSMAVQLAFARGVTVIGTADPRQHDYLRTLGAHPVAYGPGWADRVRRVSADLGLDRVDAVFDTAGHGVLPDSIRLAGGPRHVTTIADHDADRHGVHRTGGNERGDPAAALQQALHLYDLGHLTVAVAATLPLAQAAAAHERLEAGTTRGKTTSYRQTNDPRSIGGAPALSPKRL